MPLGLEQRTRVLLGCAAALFALFCAFALARDWRARDAGLALALDFDEARALCRASHCPEGDFWERARLVGAVGAVLRPERLGARLGAQQALRFSSVEIEKMRAAGLAQAAPLSADAVWVRDESVFQRLMESARARGWDLPTRRYLGMHVVELPEDVRPESFPLGYDPLALGLISSKGLTPVYWVEDAADIWPSGRGPSALEPGAASVFLLAPGLRPTGGRIALVRDRLNKRRAWLALPDSESFDGASGGARLDRRVSSAFLQEGPSLSRAMLAGEMNAVDGATAGLSAMLGRGDRLVVIHLDGTRGVEGNFDALRVLSRQLRARGYPHNLPPVDRGERVMSSGEMTVRFLLALALAVLGPIAALRLGLRGLRSLHASGRWLEASPVRELAAACVLVAGLCCLAGLSVYALLCSAQWRLGLFPLHWGPWIGRFPLLVGFLALYVPEVEEWGVLLKKPAARRHSRSVLVAAAAACLFAYTPRWFEQSGPRAWLMALLGGRLSWWMALRWREIFVGYPCLIIGLWIYFQRLEAAKSGSHSGDDPRPWLFLSLLAPIGILHAFASTYAPFELVLAHTAQAALAGSAAGLALIGARALALSVAPRISMDKLVHLRPSR